MNEDRIIKKLISFLIVIGISLNCLAQTKDDKTAIELMHKAFGKVTVSDNYSIKFRTVAFGLKNPGDIYSYPAYKVFKGGYLHFDKDKFEMNIGAMKGLSDGKLVVIINEAERTMIVDSIRKESPLTLEDVPDVNLLIKENFKDADFKYITLENLNGKSCHKIKAEVADEQSSHVFYYINSKSGDVELMAEWQGSSYDVYEIEEITNAPKGYVYEFYLPKKEIETMKGYEVIDMRFISESMRNKL